MTVIVVYPVLGSLITHSRVSNKKNPDISLIHLMFDTRNVNVYIVKLTYFHLSYASEVNDRYVHSILLPNLLHCISHDSRSFVIMNQWTQNCKVHDLLYQQVTYH